MEYGAIDLHLRHSVIRIVRGDGTVVLERRIPTTRASLVGLFGGRARLRVLLESGTESEWVAQALEACGHEVIVADPNYALMYGQRGRRRVKTDRRDVAALAEACRLGIYRRAHRVSAAQRQRRRELRVREQLIRVRTQLINLLRAQLRQEGLRLPSGSAECARQRYAQLAVPAELRAALRPLLAGLEGLAPVITACDQVAQDQAAADPVVQQLMTAPGVGPITGLTFRAVVDDVGRFGSAGAASAYVGLVPSEDSSGRRQRKGAITKAGSGSLRALLVQAAWHVWRRRAGPATLQAWVHQVAERRGRRIAVVALARRLTRILYAMWRDGVDYRPRAVIAAA